MGVRKNLKNSAAKVLDLAYVSRSTKVNVYKSGMIKLASLYLIRQFWGKILVAAICGLIVAIMTIFFVKNTGLYSGGTTALFQGISRLIYYSLELHSPLSDSVQKLIYNLMFWGFYTTLNIPLIIFAYKKINKRFAIISCVYLLTTQISGFAFSNIPGIDDILIFGDTSTVDGVLAHYKVNVVAFSPNLFPTLKVDFTYDWQKVFLADDESLNPLVRTWIQNDSASKGFLLFTYSIFFSFVTSFLYSITYIIGGSTAGSDFISIYFSQEKNKSLGLILVAINGTALLLGIFFGSYVSCTLIGQDIISGNNESFNWAGTIKTNPYAGWQYLFSANMFSSALWVVLHGILVSRLFPWQKVIRVEVFTSNEKLQQIRDKFKAINFTHPQTIINTIGGYSNKENKMLIVVLPMIEFPTFVDVIRKIDSHSMISAYLIRGLDGSITTQKQTG